jgi:hypothetical protein
MLMMNNSDMSTDTDWQQIEVECYSGYKANERPVAFTALACRWEVSEIVDRWYEGVIKREEPVVNYFKVKTSDGSIFILRYDAHADVWSILFQQ